MATRTTTFATASIALLVLLSGCTGAGGGENVAGQVSLGKPQVQGVTNELGDVTTSTTEIVTGLKVNNPNPVALPVEDVRTRIQMSGVDMGTGSAEKAEIKPESTSEIVISTQLDNSKIPTWWVNHVENGERTTVDVTGEAVFDLKFTQFSYPITRTRTVETDILSRLDTSSQRSVGKGPLEITLHSLDTSWGEVTGETTEIRTEATLTSQLPVPVTVSGVSYDAEMNGVPVAESTSSLDATLQPGEETTLIFTTEIRNGKLDEWWVQHLKNGEQTTATFTLKPTVEFRGQKQTFTLAQEQTSFSTNLFG